MLNDISCPHGNIFIKVKLSIKPIKNLSKDIQLDITKDNILNYTKSASEEVRFHT